MKTEKTTLTEFLDYIVTNKLTSARLMNCIKSSNGYIYDFNDKVMVEDIRDITDDLLISLRNVGIKTVSEFKELRENYLQYITIIERETDDNATPFFEREKYSCWMRSDILQSLETIQDETSFIENALIEKFEREQIPFITDHSNNNPNC